MNTKHIFNSLLVIMLCMISANVIAEDLKEGEWQGALVNELGKRYKLKYLVQYKKSDAGKVLKIEMINLDLEPLPDYTYQLIDIKYDDKKISFKIPREHDHRTCTLSKESDGKYVGECQSNKATQGEVSSISLLQVKKESEEAAPTDESVTQEKTINKE